LIGITYRSEISTVDSTLRDVSLQEISAIHTVPFAQGSPVKNGILINVGTFRIGFLPRYGLSGALVIRTWKYSLWATIL